MMTHEMFSRLGIPATDDIRAIKRAYATALKSIDQQTQQAEFEALRRAYEAALERASRPAPQALAENGGLQPEPAAPPDALPAAAPAPIEQQRSTIGAPCFSTRRRAKPPASSTKP